jgi:hypothetical protein
MDNNSVTTTATTAEFHLKLLICPILIFPWMRPSPFHLVNPPSDLFSSHCLSIPTTTRTSFLPFMLFISEKDRRLERLCISTFTSTTIFFQVDLPNKTT